MRSIPKKLSWSITVLIILFGLTSCVRWRVFSSNTLEPTPSPSVPPPAKTTSEDGSEIASTVQHPKSLIPLSTLTLAIIDEVPLLEVHRPDVVAINNQLWLAIDVPPAPGMQTNVTNIPAFLRLDTKLQKLERPAMFEVEIPGTKTCAPPCAPPGTTDVRVGSAKGKFWMAFETVSAMPLPNSGCTLNFLNAGSISNFSSGLSSSVITQGCPLLIGNPGTHDQITPAALPTSGPIFADDPTPFFHQGHYYILSRAWNICQSKTPGTPCTPTKNTIQHLTKLNADLTFSEDIPLDVASVQGFKTNASKTIENLMSQNALLHINGKPFLVAGFASGPVWESPFSSSIYIIPLNDGLTAFSGPATELPIKNCPSTSATSTAPQPPTTPYLTRVTRARHVNGTLIINFNDYSYPANSTALHVSENLALFDVNANFACLSRIQTQNQPQADNHSSFEIIDDQLFLFQQVEGGKRISAKIFRLSP